MGIEDVSVKTLKLMIILSLIILVLGDMIVPFLFSIGFNLCYLMVVSDLKRTIRIDTEDR